MTEPTILGTHTSRAVIDNGPRGTREITFSTGRLARQAAGSVIAQLGSPDMRIPIAHALAWPERMPTPAERLDLARHHALEFEEPDLDRFPALRLAREALAAGGAAPVILNAANEVAVAAFLERRIGFAEIAGTVARVLAALDLPEPHSVAEVIDIDREVRKKAREIMPLPVH